MNIIDRKRRQLIRNIKLHWRICVFKEIKLKNNNNDKRFAIFNDKNYLYSIDLNDY
jgi:hypothetical protein